jgi:hypothetical protein
MSLALKLWQIITRELLLIATFASNSDMPLCNRRPRALGNYCVSNLITSSCSNTKKSNAKVVSERVCLRKLGAGSSRVGPGVSLWSWDADSPGVDGSKSCV